MLDSFLFSLTLIFIGETLKVHIKRGVIVFDYCSKNTYKRAIIIGCSSGVIGQVLVCLKISRFCVYLFTVVFKLQQM